MGRASRVALLLTLAMGLALRIAYGWPAPDADRAVDERFSLENAEMLLRNRTFKPSNAFHPSLSYLPQTLVMAAVEACGCLELGTGTSEILRPLPAWTPDWRPPSRSRTGIRTRPRLTPLAFRTCRITQALFGTATIALTFVLGRLLFSSMVGLFAALLLALTPWQIWASGTCNEDAGFVLTFLVGVLATLACLRRPTTLRFVLAGVAFGLAGSAKYNALPVVVPLTVWVLASRSRWRALLPRLVLAGAVAIGVVAALNPHLLRDPKMVRRDFFGTTMRNYKMKSHKAGNGRGAVAAAAITAPLAPEEFGPVAGTLALGGLVYVVGVGWRRRRSERLIAVGFPVGYVLTYVVATGNSSAHNWMPLDPVFAVAAAAVVVGLARWIAVRSRYRRLAAAGAATAIAAGLAWAGPDGARYLYTTTVPPTQLVAERWLDERCTESARIGVESQAKRRLASGRPRYECVELVAPGRKRRFSAAELADLDGWVTDDLADGARGGEAAGLVARGGEARRFEARRFDSRGPTLVAVWRPWLPTGLLRLDLPAGDEAGRRSFEVRPAELGNPPRLSIQIFPRERWRSGDCSLHRAGGRGRLGLTRSVLRAEGDGKRAAVRTQRFRLDEPVRFELVCPPRGESSFELADFVLVTGWRPTGGATAAGARR